MPNERKQFGILLRAFLAQVVDVDLISPGGEMQTLLIQFAALLSAFNFVVAIVIVPRYGTSPLPHATLMTNAWSDEEFLINTTISITGLFMVLAWDSFLPDLRDRLVLGVLPVRVRTIAFAKVAAVGIVLALSVLLVNIFTGFCYAIILAAPGSGVLGLLRAFSAYWITMAAAALFMACLLVSVRSLAAQLLPYRLFARVSNFIQVGAFFAILAVYFLKPPLATPSGLTSPHNRFWLDWVPSYWFLGVFQQLNGPMHPVFRHFAGRALWGLLASGLLATATFALGYRRSVRRLAEQPDIPPADRSRRASHLGGVVAKSLFTTPLDRAIFLFTARTLARSRKHRLLLAMYGGIGLAIAIAYMESLLHGGWKLTWNQPNAPLLVASLVMLLFVTMGTRIVFALPFALRSNWIFRVSAVHSPQAYFAAIRKSLYVLTAFPIWIALAIFFFAIWPGRSALQHLLVLVLGAVFIVERSLCGFRKIPFACSYLPGKANLQVTLTMYGTLVLFAAHQGGQLEFWAMQRPARYLVLVALLAGAAFLTRQRFNRFAAAPFTPIQFQDFPPGEILRLDILSGGEFMEREAYIDARARPAFRQRALRVAMVVLVLLPSGFAYEQFGEWRDRKLAPQVGRAVDIGGRSLNIYCSGEGAPTVILESNWGAPGYSWLPIQREIAKFTRVCWYDRAGYGWSDPGPYPNHSDSIARDLHRLLTAAHIPPPYVLAAHAMGAFHARVYRGFYPNEVVGLVLIDPMNEDMTIHIHNHIEALRPAALLIRRTFGNLGLARLTYSDPGQAPRGYTQQEWNTLVTLKRQLKSRVAEGMEPPLWICGELARAGGGFGDIPVVVLSAGIRDQEEDPKLDNDQPLKWELHRKLAGLSTRGTQVIVENSGHDIPEEAPEAVVNAVGETVTAARKLFGLDKR